jgi:CheY-like chemotaxis protein
MPQGGHLYIETQNVDLHPSDGKIRSAEVVGPHVLLSVRDTGCGMDEATLGRIFEPFFTTKEVGKGTGLGLATVYGIVNQSGGYIEVDSEFGKGTTFRIYLPRVKQMTVLASPSPGPQHDPIGTETILMVEDEDIVRSLVRMILQSKGYTVLEASDGEQALRILEQQMQGTVHLLLTDLIMPKMSGRQLAELVVQKRPSIKVLYLSGYTNDAAVQHGIWGPDTAFLQKPFTPIVLARKVREVLDK